MGEEIEEKEKDEHLVRLSKNGDKDAFEQLVIRYQDKIFSIIFRVVKNRDLVHDLAQDTFIKAYRSLGGFKGRSSFYTWLYQIAVRTALNYISLSSVRTTRSFEEGELENRSFEGPGKIGNWLEEGYIISEAARAAVIAVEDLSEEYKSVFILKEYEDLSYEEIASALNIPLGTVRSRLNRARKELRNRLKSLV